MFGFMRGIALAVLGNGWRSGIKVYPQFGNRWMTGLD